MNARITFDDSSERNPVWEPDSQHLIFSSDKGGWSLLRVGIDSTTGPEVILKGTETYRPMDVTADNVILLREAGRSFLRLSPGAHQPEVFLQTIYMKSGGRLSPNNKWLAFNAGDSGRDEVYVTPFPKADRRQQISTNGGVQALWNSSGDELYFLDPQGRVMAVTIDEKNPTTIGGSPRLLFSSGINPSAGLSQYAVSGDGSRFLTIVPVAQQEASPIDVIVNWAPR